MQFPHQFILRGSVSAAAIAAALTLTSCFTNPPATSGTASGANRFGYGGTSTTPSGINQQPAAGPDGSLANALSGNAPATGTQAQQNIPGTPSGSTPPQSGGVLPTANSNPPSVPDAGVDPSTPASPPSGGAASGGGVDPSQPAATPGQPKKDDFPYGIPVPGREGLVYSPYDREAGYVDVRDLEPGSLVEDPYTKKFFRVP